MTKLEQAARAQYEKTSEIVAAIRPGNPFLSWEELPFEQRRIVVAGVRAILTAIRDLRAEDQPIVDAMREAALAGSHDFLYDRAWTAAINSILKNGA